MTTTEVFWTIYGLFICVYFIFKLFSDWFPNMERSFGVFLMTFVAPMYIFFFIAWFFDKEAGSEIINWYNNLTLITMTNAEIFWILFLSLPLGFLNWKVTDKWWYKADDHEGYFVLNTLIWLITLGYFIWVGIMLVPIFNNWLNSF